MDSTTTTSQCFRFMDLPPEVRKEIYDYFVAVPKNDAGFGEEVVAIAGVGEESYDCFLPMQRVDVGFVEELAAISKTRRSLLNVSHQINAEWSPTFFRTTTIIVHGPRSEYLGGNDRRITTGRALSFEKAFLKSASASILSNIRRLCYDASIHGRFESVSYQRVTTVNFPNLRQFARILDRYRTDLSSLQDVELYARWQIWHGGNRDLRPWGLSNAAAADVWARASEGGLWEEIEQLLVRRNRRAALTGWSVVRKVNICHFRCPFPSQMLCVHVHFSKRHPGHGAGESVADPGIVINSLTLKNAHQLHQGGEVSVAHG
ncbi:hypothetical protein G647_04206 [Cladophialophora carrionii CBS 160.54]|uniref:Uncharacterized protein n=1 Tax=Cladophialophora carrionii CBS 160.54 TaxID=1279043 RepID=V9DDS6_9EURO|nr:uncharacterized protein G647_04206 [Cladophialophora carrionii CBS 160.54]ETI24836.1 hypothetical protein G647_04206 [Cladophialophora carrionii CBS 160.54]